MIVTALVKTGVGKERCDDAIFNGDSIIAHDDIVITENGSNTWVAVVDGVGGNAGGNEASAFLLEYVNNNYRKSDDDKWLYSMLRDANTNLIQHAKESGGKENMATTFTGIFWGEADIKIAHSGNTRIYALQGNYLKQLTTDHTTYQWLMMQGNYEAADNCNKSEIISCFGGGDESLLKMLSIESIPFESMSPVLIMTTDGIHDYVDIDSFEELIKEQIPMKERIVNLWKVAKENGSCDDCSIIVLEW